MTWQLTTLFVFDIIQLWGLWFGSIYFVKVHVPETKGLTLEEIEQKFKSIEAERTGTSTSTGEADPLIVGRDGSLL
jgi:hypothetical protein